MRVFDIIGSHAKCPCDMTRLWVTPRIDPDFEPISLYLLVRLLKLRQAGVIERHYAHT